jgi:unspecific monooxygenase
MTSADITLPGAPAALVPPRPAPASDDLSTLGRALMIRRNAIASWGERAYQDDVVEGRFFRRTSLILNDPDAIRHVLVDHDESYGRTAAAIRVLRPMLGEGLLLSTGRPWKHQRRTLAPAFTPRAVTLLVPHMRAVIAETVAALGGQTAAPVDLREAMQRMTLEIAGRTMFSVGMARHGAALRGFVNEYGARLAQPHLLDLVLPLGWPTPQDLRRALFRRRWTGFVRGMIAERRASPSEAEAPRDLFDLMLAARDPETGEGFSDDHLVDQVATMILAGHETTATALFWALFLLAQDQPSQDRVAQEAAAAGASPDPASLPFTRAVVDETLRLYPPAFLIARQANRPDTVAGRPVRPGDVILVAPWLLHRHARLWRDPHAFAPQRFLDGPAPDRFAYLPFGVGPRICIGAHFALVEAVLALAGLVARFRISLADQKPVMPIGVVTTQPDRSPPFRLSPRD